MSFNTETPKEIMVRLREIREEAKKAKSDIVLHALAAERRDIIREHGQKCTGCGE